MFHMRNIVGEQVKQGRQNLGLTQKQLATKLQLSGWKIQRSGIAKIETGLRQVTDIELIALAKELNVAVNWLLKLSERDL